ncbi:MAG: hypothetical protein QNJ68_21370 [Microcoleaceae cyanobacterium MO_207.B10]|nr:hypothetical protein [Microcoleaceae cyanobacterium MO_207.B10]
MKLISKNHEPNVNAKILNKAPHPFFLALFLTGILACEVYPNLTEIAFAAVNVIKYEHLETNNKTYKSNKFASLLKTIQDTNGANTENYQPDSLYDQIFNQTLTISQSAINEKLYDFKKLSKTTPKSKFNKIAQNSENLPNDIADAVRQDLAQRIGISAEKIEVSQASEETWPNTCLGLPNSDELCAQMLVEGWRIVLSNGSDSWVYRTDNQGKLLRVEP